MKLSELVNELVDALRDLGDYKAGLAAAETRVKSLREQIDALYATAPHANGKPTADGERNKRVSPDYDRTRRVVEFLRSRGGVATILEFAKHDKCDRQLAGHAFARLAKDKSSGVVKVSKGRYKLN